MLSSRVAFPFVCRFSAPGVIIFLSPLKIHVNRMYSLLFLLSFTALVLQSSLSSAAFCSEALFGTPNPVDCTMALHQMPFARNPSPGPRSEARALRFFSEPQLLEPPFHDIINRYSPHDITQLPKIYKFSMS